MRQALIHPCIFFTISVNSCSSRNFYKTSCILQWISFLLCFWCVCLFLFVSCERAVSLMWIQFESFMCTFALLIYLKYAYAGILQALYYLWKNKIQTISVGKEEQTHFKIIFRSYTLQIFCIKFPLCNVGALLKTAWYSISFSVLKYLHLVSDNLTLYKRMNTLSSCRISELIKYKFILL